MPPHELTKRELSSVELTDRDKHILQHIEDYRISTPEVIHRLYFGESKLNAVTKVTSRLLGARFIVRHELFHKHIYFVLGKRVERTNDRAGLPLGPSRLIQAYGVLIYCCMGQRVNDRITPSEWNTVREKFSNPPHSSLAPHFPLLDFNLERRGDKLCLNSIHVDHGGKPSHILQKLWRKFNVWINIEGFEELVKAGLFALTFVAESERKKRVIEDMYRNRPFEGVTLRVVCVEELVDLIARQLPPTRSVPPTEAHDAD